MVERGGDHSETILASAVPNPAENRASTMRAPTIPEPDGWGMTLGGDRAIT